jgi:hypothetical protein
MSAIRASRLPRIRHVAREVAQLRRALRTSRSVDTDLDARCAPQSCVNIAERSGPNWRKKGVPLALACAPTRARSCRRRARRRGRAPSPPPPRAVPRPEEDRALRDRAADGGTKAGERAPERRAHAERCQRVVQLLPGGAALDGHPTVIHVDVEYAVHPPHDPRTTASRRSAEVAPRVGHAAAARHQHQALLRRDAHHRRDLLGRTGTDDGERWHVAASCTSWE